MPMPVLTLMITVCNHRCVPHLPQELQAHDVGTGQDAGRVTTTDRGRSSRILSFADNMFSACIVGATLR